ncbi:MAG: DUF1674 domain-containing protein [Proteobacteria bacterium]|nr:DUF1674 domain-containing protein [Pseudomonadota bacterium]MDA0993402.1 DUF1674 domain-containing protein [Pseudomonadota bacterium]
MADDTSKIRGKIDSDATSSQDDNVETASGVTGGKKEIGGRDGPDPTRFGDWEKNGRCIDF